MKSNKLSLFYFWRNFTHFFWRNFINFFWQYWFGWILSGFFKLFARPLLIVHGSHRIPRLSQIAFIFLLYDGHLWRHRKMVHHRRCLGVLIPLLIGSVGKSLFGLERRVAGIWEKTPRCLIFESGATVGGRYERGLAEIIMRKLLTWAFIKNFLLGQLNLTTFMNHFWQRKSGLHIIIFVNCHFFEIIVLLISKRFIISGG